MANRRVTHVNSPIIAGGAIKVLRPEILFAGLD